MKKILIVDCNAKLGGIQKALISFIQQESRENDISVLFLNKTGCLLSEIPPSINVYSTQSDFRFMGMTQTDCVRLKDRLKRGFYVVVSRYLGQKMAVKIATMTLNENIPGEYDEVISFSHMADNKSFYGGTPQYVLKINKNAKRTCYIHCDYLNSGNRSRYSDQVYRKFDKIVCVSESTKNTFLRALPDMEGRVFAKYNNINGEEIRRLAHLDPYYYDNEYINALIVARMTKEKGIGRAVKAIEDLGKRINLRLYVVGDGKEKANIIKQIADKGFEDRVFLLGETTNPYRYMLNADFLLVPSYHEAAPVIFQEAIELDLPVLTTRTTSADEMIGQKYGMVVNNDDNALRNGIEQIVCHPELLIKRNKV